MNRFTLTKRVAILGITANVFLLISKLSVGFLTRSQAMIADGFNSAGDVFASVMTYAGNRIASRPEDHTHPYGHGKAEYIFSMIISFSLILVAYIVFKGSLSSLISRETFTFSWLLVLVSLFTIFLKLSLFLYTKKAGKKHDNLLLIANSEDHRNDILVTSSTLLGIILGNQGIYFVDSVVGVGISLWIAYSGFKIFWNSYRVLMDTNIDRILNDDIIKTVASIKGVDHIDNISAKPVGINFIIIIKVAVPGSMTVNESHMISGIIRARVKELKKVEDVVVHINPA